MVLAYYGIQASEEELGILAKTTLDRGTTPANLARTARSFGLSGSWKRDATIENLKESVEAGIPVIVDWFSTDEGHYSVVIGINDTRVTILDPETGKRRSFPIETFLRVWFDFPFPHIKRSADLRIRWMLALRKR